MLIGIFRTNICTHQDKNNVIRAIQAHFNILDCTIDVEDCDKVLRIVTDTAPIEENDVILFIQRMGYQCDRLD
jgi:hypothetical protein